MADREQTTPCRVCRNEQEPGYLETDNNGPIVPCYWCNRAEWNKSLRCEGLADGK